MSARPNHAFGCDGSSATASRNTARARAGCSVSASAAPRLVSAYTFRPHLGRALVERDRVGGPAALLVQVAEQGERVGVGRGEPERAEQLVLGRVQVARDQRGLPERAVVLGHLGPLRGERGEGADGGLVLAALGLRGRARERALGGDEVAALRRAEAEHQDVARRQVRGRRVRRGASALDAASGVPAGGTRSSAAAARSGPASAPASTTRASVNGPRNPNSPATTWATRA